MPLTVANRIILACLLSLAAGWQANQPATRPATQPTTQPTTQPAEAADDVLGRLLQTTRPTTGPASDPSRPLSGDRFAGGLNNATGGGTASVAPDTPPQRLVREGTYIIDRLGTVRPSNDQRGLEFVFAADGEGRNAAVDAPMLLLPNLNLVAVESVIRTEPDRRLRVTGRVTEYRGRNYLLLEKVVVE
jgi:hypothetical protein